MIKSLDMVSDQTIPMRMFLAMSNEVTDITATSKVTAISKITVDRANTIPTLFRQLAHALSVLSSAAELTTERQDETSQNIRIWLQPSARQAEEALQRLRELHLLQSHTLTDLVQSLTVLVLAADMIAQGQMCAEQANESFALMRRNAERAMSCLLDLWATLQAE